MLVIRGLRFFAFAAASYSLLATFAIQIVNVYPDAQIAARVQYYVLCLAAWGAVAMIAAVVLKNKMSY